MKMKKLDKVFSIAENGEYIRNRITGEKLIPHITNEYKVFSIKIDKKYYNQIRMANLNWMAHHGPPPIGYAVHHKIWSKDREINKKLKLNDHISNLDCLIHGRHSSLHNAGKCFSENHKRNLRKPKSKEARKRMSKAQTGKHISKETREKMRKANSGEKAYNSKFIEDQVCEIRKLWWSNHWTQQKIADKFNVSKSCIAHVVNGHTYNVEKLSRKQLKAEFCEF